MNKEEPKVLTRMRLSCCWGDNLNKEELNEIVDYINNLQQENKQLKEIIDKAIEYIEKNIFYDEDLKYERTNQALEYEEQKYLLKILKGDDK